MPITYSLEREQMHHALRHYKDDPSEEVRRKLTLDLTAVLWRFLHQHEACVAHGSGANEFDLVTVVPSSQKRPGSPEPLLTQIVGRYCGQTSQRYHSLLTTSGPSDNKRLFDKTRFATTADLKGNSVLLIDDTWTTGASAQSAAWALKDSGASRVGTVVIGRHVSDEYEDHKNLYGKLSEPFDWDTCIAHEPRERANT